MLRKFSAQALKLRKTLECYHNSLTLWHKPSLTAAQCQLGKFIRIHSQKCRYSASTTIPIHIKAEEYKHRVAIEDCNAHYTYDELIKLSYSLACNISARYDGRPLAGERIAFLCPNEASYVVVLMTIWRLGAIAVPLSPLYPKVQLQYFIQNSLSSMLIHTNQFEELSTSLSKDCGITSLQYDLVSTGNSTAQGDAYITERDKHFLSLNKFKNTKALIIYTSGTTGRPKGVVHTLGSLHSQMHTLHSAWKISKQDRVLHVLPLHHVHGIVNALLTTLYSGATCLLKPKFDANEVWQNLVELDGSHASVLHAVPSIYARLLQTQQTNRDGVKNFIRSACQHRIRLFVSGSSALPEPILQQWLNVTGHTLLERYGMTEIGMGLSQPLHGERRPGFVGLPLPGVEVMIATPNVYAKDGYDVICRGTSRRTTVTDGLDGESGELFIRGPSLFREYWNNREATREAFTPDGWFKTGDTAIYENGQYKILGRTSVDVIKSGGYKISALDIESHILEHSTTRDCAVLGVPDMTWGQRVAAVVTFDPNETSEKLLVKNLLDWLSEQLPKYQLPSEVRVMDNIPRNAMGKVNKKELLKAVFPHANQRTH